MKKKQGRVTERAQSQRVEEKEIKKFISRETSTLPAPSAKAALRRYSEI
jgi:hypothetical protein